MRYFLCVALSVTGGCALLRGDEAKKQAPAENKLVATGEAPSWIGQKSFTITSTSGATRIAGVGVETIETGGDPCWSSLVLVGAVKNRALAELAKVLDVAPDSEAAIAALQGAEVKLGWFDGRRTLYALAEIEVSRPLPAHAPKGGIPIARLESTIKDAARAHLEATGVCRDPYKRLEVACCGGAATFCSDPKRFDRGLPGGKCACGDGPPCHQDYLCEERQGSKKCICRGPSCPCEIRGCAAGQTCGDARCY